MAVAVVTAALLWSAGPRVYKPFFYAYAAILVLGPYTWRKEMWGMDKGDAAWNKGLAVKSIDEIQGSWGDGSVIAFDWRGVVFMNALVMNAWRGKDFVGDVANALIFKTWFFIPTGGEYNHVGGAAHLIRTSVDGVDTIAMQYDNKLIVDYFKWENEARQSLIGVMTLAGERVAHFKLGRRLRAGEA